MNVSYHQAAVLIFHRHTHPHQAQLQVSIATNLIIAAAACSACYHAFIIALCMCHILTFDSLSWNARRLLPLIHASERARQGTKKSVAGPKPADQDHLSDQKCWIKMQNVHHCGYLF